MRINCKVQKKWKNAHLVWYEYSRRKNQSKKDFYKTLKKNMHKRRLYILERNKKQKYTRGIYMWKHVKKNQQNGCNATVKH